MDHLPNRSAVGNTGDPAQDDSEQVESAAEAVNASLARLTPWLISGAAHAAVVLLVVYLVSTTMTTSPADEPDIIPFLVAAQEPGVRVQQTVAPNSTEFRTVESRTVSNHLSDGAGLGTPGQSLTSGAQRSDAGPGGGSAAKPHGGLDLLRLCRGDDSTDARTQPGSPFAGTTAKPPFVTDLFGCEGNARAVVFLIDASGSLIDTLPLVLQELQRSVSLLRPGQRFSVMFFQGDQVVEAPPRGLKRATLENTAALSDWLVQTKGNIVAMGDTTPIAAIKAALEYRPDLLYILSDNITGSGRYQVDQRQLLQAVHAVNRRQTKINTIQFIYPDPLEQTGRVPTMKMIARQTGGTYKFVKGIELGL